MSVVAPVAPVVRLPDPVDWTVQLVTFVGEARRGIRPWKQVYPLLDLPVVSQVWPERRVRYPPSWRVSMVRGEAHSDLVWEMVAVVRSRAPTITRAG